MFKRQSVIASKVRLFGRGCGSVAAAALVVAVVVMPTSYVEADTSAYVGTVGKTDPSGPSGYPGNDKQRIPLLDLTAPTSDTRYVYGLEIGESADAPVWFRGHYNGKGGFGSTEWLGNGSRGQTKVVMLPKSMAVTGIEVCTNGPANDPDKHRVKGVKLYGKNFNPATGKLEGGETMDKYELPNCPNNGWRGKKSCSSGEVAVGFDIHKSGSITGIGLLCSAFGSKPVPAWAGQACKLGGPACIDGTFCKFTANENCGKSTTVGGGAVREGMTLAPPGECTIIKHPVYCSGTSTPVCGCDGKDYASNCLAWSAGTSVASIGACSKK